MSSEARPAIHLPKRRSASSASAFLEIALVILLGAVERLCWFNLGDNRTVESAGVIQLAFGRLGCGFLQWPIKGSVDLETISQQSLAAIFVFDISPDVLNEMLLDLVGSFRIGPPTQYPAIGPAGLLRGYIAIGGHPVKDIALSALGQLKVTER